MMIKKQLLFLTLTLAMLALAACAPTLQSTPDNILVPAPSIVPSPTASLQSVGCRMATATSKLFVDTEDGYCLLYPAEFTLQSNRLIVLNPKNMPGDVPGDAWLIVSVSGAEGQTAAQAADARITKVGAGFNITRTEITVDGKQAIVVDGLPGQDPNRQVFIVNNDRLYRFDFEPWYPSKDPGQPTQLENLCTTIMDTLHFLP